MASRAPVNTQRLRPADSTALRPADFGSSGEQIGRAVNRLGQTGQEASEQQNQIQIAYAETAAKQARTDALVRVGEVRSRVTTTRGLEAEAQRQQAETEIDRISREAAASLSDPLARRMFEDSFEASVSSDRLRMREHADTQVRAAQDDQAEAVIAQSTERAISLRADPEAVARERGLIMENVALRLRGAAPETVANAQARALSAMHAGTALAILSADEAGGGLEAMTYLREHAAEIGANDSLRLFQTIQPQFDNDVVQAGFGEVSALVQSGTVSAEPITTGEQPTSPVEVSGRQYSPTRGVRRVTTEPDAHLARGRLAVDYAADPGTPIVPPTSGVVVEAPREQRGANGYMVRVRHPNGHVSTYLHMRGPSPLNVGDAVTAQTVIGEVGNTGRSSGPHVDFSVRNAQGQAVNPYEVTWTGENLELYTPQRADMAAWYRSAHQVATARGYNSRQYNALLQQVDRHIAREERLVERQQDAVDRQVLERMAELGENLISIGQVPMYGQASPQLRIQIQNQIDQNTRATEPTSNNDRFLELDDMAYGSPEDRAEFLRINPYAEPITRGEQARLRRRQNELMQEARTATAPDQVGAQLGRVQSSMNRLLGDPRSGVTGVSNSSRAGNAQRARYGALRDSVTAQVEAEQRRLGRQLTDPELDGVVRGQVLSVNFYDSPTDTSPEALPAFEARQRLQATPGARVGVDVPDEAERRITEELTARGIEATPARIIAEYRRSLMYQR